MKATILRLIVAGLILAAVGFGIYYYFNMPDPAINTYYTITEFLSSENYENFDTALVEMDNAYIAGAPINSYYQIVETSLNNNFNYYRSYLLFVQGVNLSDQTILNQRIQNYENAYAETTYLLNYFNDNQSVNETVKAQMHANFLNAYNAQIKLYVNLIESLKFYVIQYAFNGVTPVGLKQTLLQAQLDFAKVVITQKLDAPANPDTLVNELHAINLKYASYENAPQGENSMALAFVNAYTNFENLEEYFTSVEKANYVASYPAGLQADYLTIIYNFLNLPSFN